MTTCAVTRVGAVGPWGAGRVDLERALREGTMATVEVETSAFRRVGGARRAGLVRSDLTAWVPARRIRRLSLPSRFAAAAAVMALDGHPHVGDGIWGIVLATAFGTARNAEDLIRAILHDGPETASPLLFSESVANAPSAQVAIGHGARGTNVAVTQREAGPLLALAAATREVTNGRADRALAGATDEINPLVHAVLDRFRALATGDEQPQPFDRRRRGIVAAEGATVVVVEPAGGPDDLVRVRASGRAFDPTAPAHGWGTGGVELADAVRRSLDQAGLALGAVDRVVSGAAGSRSGDRLEASVLRGLWGDETLPPIVAPKAVTGEYGGGFLAAAILHASGASCRRPGRFVPDPDLGITLADEHLGPPSLTLVTTAAAGGAYAWVLLEVP